MGAYIGEIRMFSGNRLPTSEDTWMYCEGQELETAKYLPLFTVIGNKYGGSGNTFKLPDLRGKVPINMGMGAGLSKYITGQQVGAASVVPKLPAHTHSFMGVEKAATEKSVVSIHSGVKTSNMLANVSVRTPKYNALEPNVTMSPMLKASGADKPEPVSTMQPYLAISFIICVFGVFPLKPTR